MASLRGSLPLKPEQLRLFGKDVQTPRLVSWHGDPECRYGYSGRSFAPTPWTPDLLALRDLLIAKSNTPFNSVLVNYYRDGDDAMGAHSDNESELGPSADDVRIASLSLGARRRFVLSPKDRSHKPLAFALGEGDLFLMGGVTQQHYNHALPRTKKPVGPRMNLTFRVVGDGQAPAASLVSVDDEPVR